MTGMDPLPPELWLTVFQHATHVPDTLIPDVYAHASLFGSISTKSSNTALRDALITKRALVRVCKQWWQLAVPYLYASVYIGKARCLYSLSSTLTHSAAGKGTVLSTRPLGEYTQRLDIAIRDHAENADDDFCPLTALIRCMPHLTIVSFAIASNYYPRFRVDLSNKILDALYYSAASLRVLDWSSTRLGPTVSHMMNLLSECTQLRVLNCPSLIWSKELQRGGVPPTITTLHLNAIIPGPIAPPHTFLLDSDIRRHPEPSALQELILDLNRDPYYWKDLLEVYSSQLTSVQFCVSDLDFIDVECHLRLLAQVCPSLRRLTITSERFLSFIRPHLVFPSITYLGLRVTRAQSPKPDFKTLFALLEELRSIVPSLRVVQLLNEQNVQCLLRTHTKFAVRALQPFMEATPFRIEDREGVLLTGSGSPLWLLCLD